VKEFTASDKIVSFHSPLGNSDVPYPYAVDSSRRYYLLAEQVMIAGLSNLEADDVYGTYYQSLRPAVVGERLAGTYESTDADGATVTVKRLFKYTYQFGDYTDCRRRANEDGVVVYEPGYIAHSNDPAAQYEVICSDYTGGHPDATNWTLELCKNGEWETICREAYLELVEHFAMARGLSVIDMDTVVACPY
jgi:hypothetical protein